MNRLTNKQFYNMAGKMAENRCGLQARLDAGTPMTTLAAELGVAVSTFKDLCAFVPLHRRPKPAFEGGGGSHQPATA